MKTFHYFNRLRGPLRAGNFHTYAAAAGQNPYLPITVWSGMATPIGPPVRSVGIIFLGHDTVDKAFTPEAMATLQIFASQTVLVITSVRCHREERRAKADLETLIDMFRWAWWSLTPPPTCPSPSTGRPYGSWRICVTRSR